jgi:hypothetical protein
MVFYAFWGSSGASFKTCKTSKPVKKHMKTNYYHSLRSVTRSQTASPDFSSKEDKRHFNRQHDHHNAGNSLDAILMTSFLSRQAQACFFERQGPLPESMTTLQACEDNHSETVNPAILAYLQAAHIHEAKTLGFQRTV